MRRSASDQRLRDILKSEPASELVHGTIGELVRASPGKLLELLLPNEGRQVSDKFMRQIVQVSAFKKRLNVDSDEALKAAYELCRVVV